MAISSQSWEHSHSRKTRNSTGRLASFVTGFRIDMSMTRHRHDWSLGGHGAKASSWPVNRSAIELIPLVEARIRNGQASRGLRTRETTPDSQLWVLADEGVFCFASAWPAGLRQPLEGPKTTVAEVVKGHPVEFIFSGQCNIGHREQLWWPSLPQGRTRTG